jgi:hypothetical protein
VVDESARRRGLRLLAVHLKFGFERKTMQSKLKEQLLQHIDDVLAYQKTMREKGKYEDLSGLPSWEYERFITMALAAIERATGTDSVYSKQASETSKPREARPDWLRCFRTVASILESVRDAIKSDYLESASSIIHASLFADFLEMSQHLLDEGYKDAAAVIAGSSLESHLKQLASKHGVDSTVITSAGISPKKADRLNSDLAGAKVYSVLDQKNVTAWLDLRNKAAHGEYGKYAAEQVGLLISGIRDFITRNPA